MIMETKHNIGPVGFTIVAELGASRQINVGGNFPENATKENIDATLDLILNAINRQQAKAGLISLKGEIEAMERNLQFQKEDLVRVDVRYAEAKRPPTAVERQQRDAEVLNIRRLQDDIAAKKAIQVEFEGIAA
jgi:hypothetical protein